MKLYSFEMILVNQKRYPRFKYLLFCLEMFRDMKRRAMIIA